MFQRSVDSLSQWWRSGTDVTEQNEVLERSKRVVVVQAIHGGC